MTSLTADIYGLAGKGRIADGADADLVLFDPTSFRDEATYADSMALCSGLRLVVVDGQVVYDQGVLTAARPGQFVPAVRQSGPARSSTTRGIKHTTRQVDALAGAKRPRSHRCL